MKKTFQGPVLYKSAFGLNAYKNSNNEEILTLSVKLSPDMFKDGHLEEDGEFFLFEGYASTWSLDLGDDIIERGAFIESLQKRTPKVLLQHNPDVIAGFSTEAFEDDIGLKVKGRIPKNGGNTALFVPYMGEGGIDSLSIGFRIARDDKGEPLMDVINNVRIIKKIELFEYSFVTFPMNPSAKVGLTPEQDADHVDDDETESFHPKPNKGDVQDIDFKTIREAETCLKEFGLTSAQSKTVISKIKSLSSTRDEGDGGEVKDEMSETEFEELKSLLKTCGDTSKEDTLTDEDLNDLETIINSIGD